MSLVKEILKTISNCPGGYNTIYSILYKKNCSKNKSSIKNTLSRLKKKGLLSNKNNIWEITTTGKEILLQKDKRIAHFAYKHNKTQKNKTTIVMFDIPEKKRKYRDWLRYELIEFGFEFIQQSVWFGPPLPKEFILYLEKEKLLKYIKFFKVQKNDIT